MKKPASSGSENVRILDPYPFPAWPRINVQKPVPEEGFIEEGEMMNFTNEMIKKAKTASSAGELLKLAEEEGIELSAAEAEMYFSFLVKKNGALSDDELEQVSGGKGEKPTPTPKYRLGQTVEKDWPGTTDKGTITGIDHYSPSAGWVYNVHYYQKINIWKETSEISIGSWEGLETAGENIRVY